MPIFKATWEASGHTDDSSIVDKEISDEFALGFTQTSIQENLFPPHIKALVRGFITADDEQGKSDIHVFVGVSMNVDVADEAALEKLPVPEDLLTKISDQMCLNDNGEMVVSLEPGSWILADFEEIEIVAENTPPAPAARRIKP